MGEDDTQRLVPTTDEIERVFNEVWRKAALAGQHDSSAMKSAWEKLLASGERYHLTGAVGDCPLFAYQEEARHIRRLILAKEHQPVPQCASVANVTVVQSSQENNASTLKGYERWV